MRGRHTAATPKGSHILTAVDCDAAGNTTTSSDISVEVSNNSGRGGSRGGGSSGSSGGWVGGAVSSPRQLMTPPCRSKSSFCKPFGIGIPSTPAGRAFVHWFGGYGRWWYPLADSLPVDGGSADRGSLWLSGQMVCPGLAPQRKRSKAVASDP